MTRFDITIGRCRGCHARVQPRHGEQSSDALGAAGSQLGPRVVALMVLLVKQLGATAARVATLLGQFGVEVTAGAVTGAVARTARRATPTYDALVDAIRGSPTVAADETGWRVAGAKAWLWVFASQYLTVYRIAKGRGYDVAAGVLGQRYGGVIERDGWAPYRRFEHATHNNPVMPTCSDAATTCSPTRARDRRVSRMRCAGRCCPRWPYATTAPPVGSTPRPTPRAARDSTTTRTGCWPAPLRSPRTGGCSIICAANATCC